MPAPFKDPDQIIREGFQQFGPFVPIGATKDTKDQISNIQTYDDYLNFLKDDAKLPDDLADTVASSTLYGLLEKFGVDPEEWQFTVPVKVRGEVKYGVEEYETARKFLGTWTRVAEMALLVAGLAALAVAVIGGSLAAAALAALGLLLRKGATKIAINTLLAVVKLRGIKWLSLPAAVLGIATATSFFANTQITATGDLTTYIAQGVARGEEAQRKIAAQQATLLAGGGVAAAAQTRTIIRMVEEKKPEQFIGTLFSAKLGKMESFTRVIDDEITDEDDLREDVKLNLNRWLSSLPGRLGYSVVIRKDPVDEFGVKQSGIWATLTTHFTRLSGPIQPIDTILLGPVTPATRLKLSKVVKTITHEIPGMLTGQEIRMIEVPGGSVDIFDTTGERVDTSTPRVPLSTPTFKPPVIKTPAEQIEAQRASGVPVTPPVSPAEQIAVAAAKQAAEVTPPPATDAPLAAVTAVPTAETVTPPTTTDADFDKNEFEGGVRGAFIQQLGVFQNQILRVNTGGGNLNARESGGLNFNIKFKIPNRTTVIVDSWNGTADGHEWARIRTLPGNKSGVVAATFLEAL